MGKSDEKQTEKRAHRAASCGRKQSNKPSFDTLGSTPFATTPVEDNDVAISRHSKWSDFFRQLCEYKVQFGHCIVPHQYPANLKLGQWVSRQRTRYRKNTEEKSTSLIAEHIRALDGIGFDWGTNKTDWNVRFAQLRDFMGQFGHCLVPFKYSPNPDLGQWVSTQRYHGKLYQDGKASRMTAERIQELDGISFYWGTSKTNWSARLVQLREFKAQFGHCLVPTKYPANPKLGRWVSNLRSRYRLYQGGKPDCITAERIRALDGIGFEWKAPSAAKKISTIA
jgi:hypothetical protein